MEKEIAGTISIIAGVITFVLCGLTLYVYPTLAQYRPIVLIITLLGLITGLYLILLGYKFTTGNLPSMKIGSRLDGMFIILAGIIFILLPPITYLAGLRNPWILIFIMGGLYYIFLGNAIYRGKLDSSMKPRFRFF
ncbi:hypothetical protein GF345_03430 [Candidatus Woesearchaeota archaeon]|nr:hypothetical protein [Candidatus Woesearchaeota archaeon]